MKIESYIEGKWYGASGAGKDLFHAVNGSKVYEISSEGIHFERMLEYAKDKGGRALRQMTFHERSLRLKELALYLTEKKEAFYEISKATGATRKDSWIDIDGGIGTLFVISSKGRRELPNEKVYIDGDIEPLSREGTFIGRHICVPLEGVAVHINAFNFPCWGFLEKFSASFLAGVPSIVKPASQTAYLTESMVKSIIQSNILPEGSLQLICGGVGDLLDHMTGQDVVTFTGSAETGLKLKSHPAILRNNTRFNMEADSLNCSILGMDVKPEDEEFGLFVKEVVREMTSKTGQKCTAIRRIFVPENLQEAVIKSLKEKLSTITIGDPSLKEVRMGPLASLDQVEEVKRNVELLQKSADLVHGSFDGFKPLGQGAEQGAFFPPFLLHCQSPLDSKEAHAVEPFGPVSTVMPYKNVDEVNTLAKMGEGSLVGSLFTADDDMAREVVLGTASHHGRIMIVNKESAKESTGHGSPLPHLVHGGPGRAGGGEELGGVRSVFHYMQRTSLQGSPTTLSHVTNEWMTGAKGKEDRVHPFRKYFEELRIGETLITPRRTVSEADIVNFAGISGDYFYAHMDEIAAKDSLFEKRVAHGYFVLSAAAGLFVDPAPGPVQANYGLDNLRFIEPVGIGDTIQAKLTCMRKTRKPLRDDEKANGVVVWNVEVTNQNDEMVALYNILTLVECKERKAL
ncbi:MAG: phenylacetic acid degradation bifunctional protein PaaZ [Halobacteriovoraceae bacterium]|nr:phenylacetic acid degradation bifunctional protein PaaZ [Halobacteriovoraceae bacterium]|tara:strand:- start:1361 stop:3412 length:2052 start_codon:yes stop_codon:yes gene_type:complete